MALHDLKDRIKRHFGFKKIEIKGLLVTIIVLGFVASFSEWGYDTFDAKIGIINLVNAILIVALAIIARQAVQRILALAMNLKAEFKEWYPGLVIAIILAIVSGGKILFLVPGGIFLHFLEEHRLGYFRYGLSYTAQGYICLLGVLANVFLATLFKGLSILIPANTLLIKAVTINMWMALIAMLPIPPLDGSRIFFAIRGMHVFVFGSVVGWAILLNFASIWLTLLGALVLGGIGLLFYYILFEKGAWAPFD